MITPLNHYKEHDRVITRFSDAQRLIDEIKEYANSRNLSVYWRGQVDYRWGLHSSLARQLSSVTMLNDALIDKVENAILKEAAKWIDDFKYKPYRQPLARLAYLQHHGIPTRLIDFTHNPAVALFFATESLDEVDGRIFALLVRNKEVLKKTPRGTPWRDYGSNEVKIWDPVATAIIFSRLEAQEGVFAIGRLPSTRPYRTGWDELLERNRSLLAEEVRGILSVPFKLCGNNPIPQNATLPIGITFRLHVNKESVRKNLQGGRNGLSKSTITHRSIFPDIDGMRENSVFLKGLSRGMLVLR